MTDIRDENPEAFVSFYSADLDTGLTVARYLISEGIPTFHSELDLASGDDFIPRLEAALMSSTYYIPLFSKASIASKGWFRAEVSAATHRMVRGELVVVPVLIDVGFNEIPLFLQSADGERWASPECLTNIASRVRGMNRKPPTGAIHPALAQHDSRSGLSPAAEALVKLMVSKSETSDSTSPLLTLDEILDSTGLEEKEILIAIEELKQDYLAEVVPGLTGKHGWDYLRPMDYLFERYDPLYAGFDPADDALQLATALASHGLGEQVNLMSEADRLGWSARRMNAAGKYLATNGGFQSFGERGIYPWEYGWVCVSPGTLLYLRGHNR